MIYVNHFGCAILFLTSDFQVFCIYAVFSIHFIAIVNASTAVINANFTITIYNRLRNQHSYSPKAYPVVILQTKQIAWIIAFSFLLVKQQFQIR